MVLSPKHINWSGPASKLGISLTKTEKVSLTKHPKVLEPVKIYSVLVEGLKVGFCKVLLLIPMFGVHR